ncbi:MAG: hypothetical protein ACLFSQ_02520 [Candidatus Zixiibacteriota bacterium]
MKKLLLIVFVLISISLFAEDEVLFSGDVSYGGYGAPIVGFTGFDDDMHVLVGGRGGFIINNTIAIGGGGFGKATEHERTNLPMYPDSIWDINMGAGGLFLEYIWGSDRLLHMTFDASFYWGGISYNFDFDWDLDDDEEEYEYIEENAIVDAFFMIEPGANIEINMFEWMRLNAGAHYRIMTGIDKMGYENSDFSGLNISLMAKFGSF